MKQRVRTVALIRKEGQVLLMKRKSSRLDQSVFWELPEGKIKFGEQPEEAMTRIIYDYLGAKIEELRLKDVVTFLSLEGSSQLANLYIVYEICLKDGVKILPKERYSAYKYAAVDDLDKMKLDEASLMVLGFEGEKAGEARKYRDVAHSATVYIDGASRGNPGPSGIGYYIIAEDGHMLKRGGEFIGFATSRVAEYYALKEGVEQAISLGLKSVRFVSDNLMMVNQMNGVYKIKNRDLLPIYADIRKMITNFDAVAFVHVKRELNKEADSEAGLAIDRHFDESVIR